MVLMQWTQSRHLDDPRTCVGSKPKLETRNKVRLELWKVEIELCKAKLRLSHRCQPLTHTTVSGADVAGEGEGQASQASQALWGNNLLARVSFSATTNYMYLESSNAPQAKTLSSCSCSMATKHINALAVGTAWASTKQPPKSQPRP
jgi:hypothetical protein